MKKTRFRARLMLFAAAVVALLTLAGCGGGASTPITTLPTNTGTLPAGPSVTLELAARNTSFDQATLTVPAGARVTLVFDNQDRLPHNFALYTDSSAKTKLFAGEIITGPKQITYTFTAPAGPGSYFFRCDVHTTMKGTFIVE